MRIQNPQAQLTFVYSSKLLNPFAIQQMQEFCAKNNIKTFDINTDLLNLLSHDYDKKILKLVEQEIDTWVSDVGGNPAVASDRLRWIVPIIEKCGIYAEFELNVKFKDLPVHYEVQSPVIPRSYEKPDDDCFNNDFLAFAVNPDDNSLSPEALSKIREIQSEIIKRAGSLKHIMSFTEETSDCCDVVRMYKVFTALDGPKNIYKFRKFAENLTAATALKVLTVGQGYNIETKSPEATLASMAPNLLKNTDLDVSKYTNEELSNYVIEKLKHEVLDYTVIYNAGPNILHEMLFGPDFFNDSTYYVELAGTIGNKLSNFLPPHKKHVVAELDDTPTTPLNNLGETRGDLSWTPQGAANLARRDKVIESAVVTIQSYWRNKIAREQLQERQQQASINIT